ncbi:MAG: CehA/McbA family metallohydrolase [Actinomycetota bacterium]
MALTRRELIKAGAAAGALLVARPLGVLAQGLGPPEFGTSRTSRLFPGTWLAHADLHNHTLQSDGAGAAEAAFGSMRSAGLDIAALTDHTTLGLMDPPGVSSCSGCSALLGLDEAEWQRTRELADGAQEDDAFTALRGFEWSSPSMGHVNVWFSERWIDPLHTGGGTTGEGAGQFMHSESDGFIPQSLSTTVDDVIRALPTTGTSMALFYRWLLSDPNDPLLEGGRDGIAGFNHPGREVGRFGYFKFEPELRERFVSVEVFNRREDYLFKGTDEGVQSPINECLNAGWKTGLLGVTDEHGTDWGFPDGKGRAGLWVKSLTRVGVREAMEARRFFSTRLRGLRVDASANGVQMGSALEHTKGPVTFQIDIDRGREFWNLPLNVQVLTSGDFMPTIVHSEDIRYPPGLSPVPTFTADIDIEDGSWVVLRITDPLAPADDRADATWSSFGNAIAYTSPFFLEPA